MSEVITNCHVLSDVALFREKMNKHNFIFSYRGAMSHAVSKTLLSLTEKKISLLNEDSSIKKKIFGVMINCLQTICTNEQSSSHNEETLFMINKADTGYTIIHGVYLKPIHSKGLKLLLDDINNMSSESLSDLRKRKLVDFKVSEEAYSIDEITLGLVNIAKKTGKKINYHFENIDGGKDFLSLEIQIN